MRKGEHTFTAFWVAWLIIDWISGDIWATVRFGGHGLRRGPGAEDEEVIGGMWIGAVRVPKILVAEMGGGGGTRRGKRGGGGGGGGGEGGGGG